MKNEDYFYAKKVNGGWIVDQNGEQLVTVKPNDVVKSLKAVMNGPQLAQEDVVSTMSQLNEG